MSMTASDKHDVFYNMGITGIQNSVGKARGEQGTVADCTLYSQPVNRVRFEMEAEPKRLGGQIRRAKSSSSKVVFFVLPNLNIPDPF